MSQDNQNRDQQNDPKDRRDDSQNDQQGANETTRASRSAGDLDSNAQRDQVGSGRTGSSPDIDDLSDEAADEDREDDLREDGSPNRRRNNIG